MHITTCCCCCSVTQSCPTLCDSVDCSMPDFRVLHHLPEFVQTHVHWVSDDTQPSHLSSPSPPAFTLSLHDALPIYHQLPEFTQTRVHWGGDAIQPSHLSSPSPPAPNPSQHRVFSNESTLRMRWSKYWSFSFSISPSSAYSGLISFMMDWFDLLAVQGALKSLLQHYSLRATIFGTQPSL